MKDLKEWIPTYPDQILPSHIALACLEPVSALLEKPMVSTLDQLEIVQSSLAIQKPPVQ